MLAKVLLLLLLLTISIGANPGENGKSLIRKQIEEIKADSVKQFAGMLKSGEDAINDVTQMIDQSSESLRKTAEVEKDRIREKAKFYSALDLLNGSQLTFFDCISTQHHNAVKKIDQLLEYYAQRQSKFLTEFRSPWEKSLQDLKLINDSIEDAFIGVLNSVNACKTSDCERSAVVKAKKISNNVTTRGQVLALPIFKARFTANVGLFNDQREGFHTMKSVSKTTINIMDDCNLKQTKALPKDTSS